jgi:hypothetical protein
VRELVRDALRAALLFLPLRELPHALEAFLVHLERSKDKAEPTQLAKFLGELRRDSG